MKVFVLANFDVGLYQFRRELLAKLLEKGHEVTVCLPYGPLVEPLKDMGCRFIDTPLDRRGINPVKDLGLLWRYFRLLGKEKPELVVTYTIKPNIYGSTVCRMKKIPYAANITGLGTAFQGKGLLRSLVTFLYKTALKKARVVFFENSHNRQTLLEEKIVREAQCRLLPGAGVNLEAYPLSAYPGGQTRFLFMGRVMEEKGVGELFAAIERLWEEGEACTLDVLGDYEEDLSAAIEKGQRAGWLRYHGYQTDVRPFIERAHCFVLPSWHEGMANTNLECASMGRPVITSDIPGCREAVEDGVTGFLCQSKNADGLYAAMKGFLALDAGQRAAMGLAGRRRMEEIFDKNTVVAMTVAALEEIK